MFIPGWHPIPVGVAKIPFTVIFVHPVPSFIRQAVKEEINARFSKEQNKVIIIAFEDSKILSDS